MAIDINNNSGGTDGTQNLGQVVQKVGNSTKIFDSYDLDNEVLISSITGSWSERFDACWCRGCTDLAAAKQGCRDSALRSDVALDRPSHSID